MDVLSITWNQACDSREKLVMLISLLEARVTNGAALLSEFDQEMANTRKMPQCVPSPHRRLNY